MAVFWKGHTVAKFHHLGVVSRAKHPGETYLEGGKDYVTAPSKHPYGFEYLRFEADSPLPKEVRTMTHIAFEVPIVDAALKGEKVVLAPFDATPDLRVAFIMKDGVLVELAQKK